MENTQVPKAELAKLRVAVEELAILNELAVSAGATLEVEKMLDIIVQKSIKALKAEQGVIQLVTEQSDAPLKTLIRQQDMERSLLNYKIGINITGWVLKYEKPLMIENLATDARFQTTEQERAEIHTVLCVPIHFRARLFGVLMVVNCRAGETFNEGDQRLLSIIAAQSGQLIHNLQMQQGELEKQRLQQELEMAKNIQLSLLPHNNPTTDSFKITAWYEAAESVAGDYYDYFQLNNGATGVVIADVSGHGTYAALVMTMVKGVMHSVTNHYRSPAQVLSEVNDILCRILPRHIFITMIFMEIDAKSLRVRFSNAGHLPLIHYHQYSRTCEMIICRGLGLNLKPDCRYDEKVLNTSPGDFILAYTDGVTEATDQEKEMFGEERLMQAVLHAIEENAPDPVQHIRKSLNDFIGHLSHEDDIAMIGIRMKNS